MSLLSSIMLVAVFVYAVLPYLCLFLARPVADGAPRHLARDILVGTVGGLAAFCAVATSVSIVSFNFYLGLHAVLTLVGLAALARRYRQPPALRAMPDLAPAWVALALIAGAFAVRLLPILWAGHSLGGDDARFHNILIQKILNEGRTAATWAPFAQVPVMYTQGSHVLAAFLAELAHVPAPEAFNILFPIIGGLTVGIVYLVTSAIFSNRGSAIWAAATYAFLPIWGSLDYYRWGGLPNAIAMLFLCLVALIIVENVHADARRRQYAILGSVLTLVAIHMTHHYTLMVAGLFLGFGLVFTSDKELRRLLLVVAALSLLFCLPLFLAPRIMPGADSAAAGLFMFREIPLTLWACVLNLNPIFVALFVFAVWAARKAAWNPLQVLMLAWFAGLLVAFVGLEYVYRGATLLLSRFQDSFTALTPSRLVTDLAYPMSILCGFVPLMPAFEARQRQMGRLFCLAAVVTGIAVFVDQHKTGVHPEYEEAGYWLRNHTPADSLIVGSFQHLEYLAWRETSRPPLPVSEPRYHPALLWKMSTRTYQEWIMWQALNRRRVYFLLSATEARPEFLQPVFENRRIVIMTVY